ncbi:MAG: hypothetical protein ABIL25_02060 [candidate division WOR-3 bacterium]
MKPVKKGDTLRCNSCGVEMVVTKSCGCADCNIICCGSPMKVNEADGGCCGK